MREAALLAVGRLAAVRVQAEWTVTGCGECGDTILPNYQRIDDGSAHMLVHNHETTNIVFPVDNALTIYCTDLVKTHVTDTNAKSKVPVMAAI